MTKDEFKELLIRLNPANAYPVEQGNALPLLSVSTAAHCFTYEVTGADTEMLRNQLLSLNTKGCFDFTEW